MLREDRTLKENFPQLRDTLDLAVQVASCAELAIGKENHMLVEVQHFEPETGNLGPKGSVSFLISCNVFAGDIVVVATATVLEVRALLASVFPMLISDPNQVFMAKPFRLLGTSHLF